MFDDTARNTNNEEIKATYTYRCTKLLACEGRAVCGTERTERPSGDVVTQVTDRPVLKFKHYTGCPTVFIKHVYGCVCLCSNCASSILTRRHTLVTPSVFHFAQRAHAVHNYQRKKSEPARLENCLLTEGDAPTHTHSSVAAPNILTAQKT